MLDVAGASNLATRFPEGVISGHRHPSEMILETKELTKDFQGFTAVNNVNLKIARGTVHALIGPNGAGKTTCFNLITKFLPASDGKITYQGRDITNTEPADVARLG